MIGGDGRFRWLAVGAIVGPIAFDVLGFILGAMRPGYTAVSHPMSGLAIGPGGIIMRSAFLLCGLLGTVGVVAAFAAAEDLSPKARWWGAALLGVSPLGLLVAGVFTMAPATLLFHNVGVQLFCGTPVLTFPIVGLLLRGSAAWRRFGTWLILGCPTTIALIAGFMTSVPIMQMATGGGYYGLWQRALAMEVQAWQIAMAWLVLRGGPRKSARVLETRSDAARPTVRTARWLACTSVTAPVLFVAAWALLGFARPGYSWVSQPISGLGIGPGATVMNAAFVAVGVLQIAGTVGALLLMPEVGTTARWAGGILLGLSGLGAVLCGLFTWQSFAPHMLGSALGLVGPVFGFFVAGLGLRREPRWKRLGRNLLVAAALTLALGVAFFATFDLNAVMADRGVAGLTERVLATEIQVVYVALALAAVRGTSRKGYKGVAMEGFIASWYARITRSEEKVQQEQARAIAERVPAGGRVLEIAPGPGYLAIALAKHGRQEVFGVDISRTFVEIATRNAAAAGATVEFQHGNASELPYDDASFDFVICRAAFKNFTDPVGALNEIHRVLKPGGAASILDLRRESSPEEIRALVDTMRLPPVSSLWTKLTFRFFLLKNAYSREAIEGLAARSRFGSAEVVQNGVEFDLRLSKARAVA